MRPNSKLQIAHTNNTKRIYTTSTLIQTLIPLKKGKFALRFLCRINIGLWTEAGHRIESVGNRINIYVVYAYYNYRTYLGEFPWLENGSSFASKKSSSPSELEYDVSGTINVMIDESV